MKMQILKRGAWTAATVLMMLCVSQLSRADEVSPATLKQMGLAGAQRVTDAQGTEVRGQGVYGYSGVTAWAWVDGPNQFSISAGAASSGYGWYSTSAFNLAFAFTFSF